ncbi:MAG: hypothetical protein GX417_01995 [Clostridiales bacterium]|nr:hypothetical protein [Clostridiales bacterium]
MTGVLGLPLERARELLEREGVSVSVLETRSKKGVEGGTDARVIRQDMQDERHAVLVYAVFRTEPNEANA